MNDLNKSLTEVNKIDAVDNIFYTRKKIKCYENKCVLCAGMCFCVLFFVGAIHFNIQCGSFDNDIDLCNVPTYCPSHNYNCDGSDLI